MNSFFKYKHNKRIKLIFNPAAGINKKTDIELIDIIQELQFWKYRVEPFITEPNTDYSSLVDNSIKDGIQHFVVCGGDGTVSAIASQLLGKKAILSIVPIGTRNNVALSLRIPKDIKTAISFSRRGRLRKIDMGIVKFDDINLPFLEVCSIGLFSELFQTSDSIQHGDIRKLKDLISQFSAWCPSKINLVLDNKTKIKEFGHVLMVSNMPYIGNNYKISNFHNSFSDGLLDVLICADIPKISLLLGYILKKTHTNSEKGYGIQHFRVKNIKVETNPDMSILIDGRIFKGSSAIIDISHNALNITTGI